MNDINLKEANTVCECFYSALKHGETNLDVIPGLLLRIINENFWQKRILRDGKIAEFKSFNDFVITPPLAGLGESLNTLKRLCRDDPAALDAIDRVTVRGPGKTWDSRTQNNHDNVMDNSVPHSTTEQGNTRQYALRRLRKARPDLHERVINKEMTAHRAMIEAGLRRELTPLDELNKAWRKCNEEERKRFLESLTTPGDPPCSST